MLRLLDFHVLALQQCQFCIDYCSLFFFFRMLRIVWAWKYCADAISIYGNFDEDAHELRHPSPFWFVFLVVFSHAFSVNRINLFDSHFLLCFVLLLPSTIAHGVNHLVLVNFEINRAINNWWVLATKCYTGSVVWLSFFMTNCPFWNHFSFCLLVILTHASVCMESMESPLFRSRNVKF